MVSKILWFVWLRVSSPFVWIMNCVWNLSLHPRSSTLTETESRKYAVLVYLVNSNNSLCLNSSWKLLSIYFYQKYFIYVYIFIKNIYINETLNLLIEYWVRCGLKCVLCIIHIFMKECIYLVIFFEDLSCSLAWSFLNTWDHQRSSSKKTENRKWL